jgi:gamma-glutamylcyclotransferase (GGCT)/AIG2-like uncharacterized protein YtfP
MKKAVLLDLFVYGTLKRGYWNHERFCQGVASVDPAFVCGTLYETAYGIPVLRVPEATILAHGTGDPLADAMTQARAKLGTVELPAHRVHGEILTFDDPADRLPDIDRLESFRPGQSSGYERVLVPAFTNHGAYPVWCYVAGAHFERSELRRLDGVWQRSV